MILLASKVRACLRGASCIHTKQVDAPNREFSPTADEVRSSETVVAATEQAERDGKAVVLVDRKMIDRPFILRARAILDQRANSSHLEESLQDYGFVVLLVSGAID